MLAAFAKDTGPAADAIRKLLEAPTPEKAAMIAEEMAKEFGSAASVQADALANEEEQPRGKSSPNPNNGLR